MKAAEIFFLFLPFFLSWRGLQEAMLDFAATTRTMAEVMYLVTMDPRSRERLLLLREHWLELKQVLLVNMQAHLPHEFLQFAATHVVC
jgi:hypothetical protein